MAVAGFRSPPGQVADGESVESPTAGGAAPGRRLLSGQANFWSRQRLPPPLPATGLGPGPPVAPSCWLLPSSHRAPVGRDGAGCSRLPARAASTRGQPFGSRLGRRSPRRVPGSRPRRADQSPGGLPLGSLRPAGSSGPAAAGRGRAGRGAGVRRRDEARRRCGARGRWPAPGLSLDSSAARERGERRRVGAEPPWPRGAPRPRPWGKLRPAPLRASGLRALELAGSDNGVGVSPSLASRQVKRRRESSV